MENRIEQEVNRTLNCMDESLDIQVSSGFFENLSSRTANIGTPRNIAYRSRRFYPVVIVLLVVLNLACGLAGLKNRKPVNTVSDNQVTVLSSEYGIGQNSYITF